jgi:hypothetical protein
MNQVDIYIGDYRLDLFQDEEISINLNVQNIKDISKVFTDFTQSFTVPASGINNEVLKQYYRTDLDASRITTSSTTNYPIWNNWIGAWETQLQTWGGGSSSTSVENTFDFRFRVPARIEINSIPFRTGVIEMENVLLKGTEPYSYSLTFYGDLVNLSDLFGEDYLYDLDLSAYDHTYDGATILSGFTQDALFSGEVFYPLMSPTRNWLWNVQTPPDDNDIKYHSGHNHGVRYNEIKPAIKVVKLLDAMEAKYGISFTGSFLANAEFNKLYLWAHRFEGDLYDSSTAIEWQLINFNRTTGGGVEFNLSTETWTVVDTDIYELRITIQNVSAAYEIGLFQNGVQIGVAQEDAHPASSVLITFEGYGFDSGDEVQIKIRPRTATTFNYQVTDYTAYDASTTTQRFEVDQTAQATYSFQLAMSPLMPEIKIKDFLGGIVKMHNLVIIPTNSTTFSLQTLNDWYDDGVNVDITQYVDIEEVSVDRPQLYREISFEYQDTEQILGFEYQRTNQVGYGDLNAFFSWDGDEFTIELPFEQPLFELLTNEVTGNLSNTLVYKSMTREIQDEATNTFQPYVGAPVLIYGEFPFTLNDDIGFIDETNTSNPYTEVWYANTSSTSVGTGLAYSTNFGGDIDPYYLTSLGKSLYQTYWEDYITDLYNDKRRVYNISAILPLGKILKLQLNNKLIWNNQRWIINSANVNMTTGKVALQLLNDV